VTPLDASNTALRTALDQLVRCVDAGECQCVYLPHFKDCKQIALVDRLRRHAGLRRWPTYMRMPYVRPENRP
jgi:hypothetical protein